MIVEIKTGKGNYNCPKCGRKVFGSWVREITILWVIKFITCGFCGETLNKGHNVYNKR